MFFNSLSFMLFFACVLAVVAGLGALGRRPGGSEEAWIRARNAFLLAASYFFYGCWDWRFLGLILISTAVDFVVGRRLEALPADASDPALRKRWLWASVVTNLGILGVFKYLGFFVDSASELLSAVGAPVGLPSLSIVLPVGISFYTFQTLSYTIDIYRGRMSAEPSALNFATYVAFFPQLVAGPIERARDLVPQFREPTRWSVEAFGAGAFLLGWGLFKKVVIADNVAPIADAAFLLPSPDCLQSLVGAYAFAVQIYCDFSGYSDIAVGVAAMLGFRLSVNFDLPYVAQNPSDFWRRWHISLSSWLRDYLYVPLGGNRRGPRRTYVNLMLTMLLGGLWHGAAWTFVAWGAFHGALLCAYRLGTPWVLRRVPLPAGGWPLAALRLVNGVFFFHLVCVSWILFRAPSLGRAWAMIVGLSRAPETTWAASFSALDAWPLAALVSAVLVAVQALQHGTGDRLVLLRAPAPLRSVLYAAAALVFLVAGEFGGEAFIYFQF